MINIYGKFIFVNLLLSKRTTHLLRVTHWHHCEHAVIRDLVVIKSKGISQKLTFVPQAKCVVIFPQLIQNMQKLSPNSSHTIIGAG